MRATLICDLQFGSTGKGSIAGYLAAKEAPDVVVTAWSMNAGHTFIDKDNRKFVHCMLANGIVSPNLEYVLIGPGSQIGIGKLFEEVRDCLDILKDRGAKVLIHPHATVIQQHHIDAENRADSGTSKIGSTKKGCGAALAEKLARHPGASVTAKSFRHYINSHAEDAGLPVQVCTAKEYDDIIDEAARIQIEGAQGYSLGLNSGFYPYVTSRECTPQQILSDCLVPASNLRTVVGTMRTYPIRVANRYNDDGEMTGWSGPIYDDQEEITFDELGQETELTTVTKLPRRIFTFSVEQCFAAMRMCEPDKVFLNFCNYATPEYLDDVRSAIRAAGSTRGGRLCYEGWGPSVLDIREV